LGVNNLPTDIGEEPAGGCVVRNTFRWRDFFLPDNGESGKNMAIDPFPKNYFLECQTNKPYHKLVMLKNTAGALWTPAAAAASRRATPPMPNIREAKEKVPDLIRAANRANDAWNKTQLEDALNSVRFYLEKIEAAAGITPAKR